jgi:hypothetical protein
MGRAVSLSLKGKALPIDPKPVTLFIPQTISIIHGDHQPLDTASLWLASVAFQQRNGWKGGDRWV